MVTPADFELLALPLNGGAEHPRCLGVVSTAEKPFWLGADPIVDATIELIRVIEPDKEIAALTSRTAITAPALAPTDLGYAKPTGAYGGARRVRHLVVLEGGREDE
ncbi:hypothetical protein MAUB1S_10173 [Mycolicibacterium aubagnense]